MGITRRSGSLIVIFAVGLLAAPLGAEAQQQVKTPRIAFLNMGDPPPGPRQPGPITRRLRELGYVEGRTIAIEVRWAGGRPELLAEHAQELARKVDLIVTTGAQATLAAARATRTVPIVMLNTPDPVRLGVVASIARPGGNVTGVVWDTTPEILAKQVQLLKEAVPRLSRLMMLWNEGAPGVAPYVEAGSGAAVRLGLSVDLRSAATPDELERAFAEAARNRAEAVLAFVDAVLARHRTQIVELATRHRLPSMYSNPYIVRAGGLMSYGPIPEEMFRQTAVVVDKILRGANPAELPVEQPTKFELVINVKTAKALGLTIPPSLLLRADHIIE